MDLRLWMADALIIIIIVRAHDFRQISSLNRAVWRARRLQGEA